MSTVVHGVSPGDITSFLAAHRLPRPAGAPRRSPAGMVGNTPVLWIGEPFNPAGRGFWAKLESTNPGGLKDRPALHMVAAARRRGELAPGAPVIESTSGTLGLGLALAGMTYGHAVTLVTDPGMEPLMAHQLRALGAQVDLVTAPHPEGGWQEARRRRVRELLARTPSAWCPDQYHNPDNVAAYASLALELVVQLGRIDVLVAAVGTGGHSVGIARTLRALHPELRLVGVDSVRSTVFGQPAGTRLMRGLGSSIHPRNVDHAAFDEVHWVAPAEAVRSCRRLVRGHWASGGWSVGAVALVAGWLARTEPERTRVVAVFPDGVHRYWNTVYSDDYCRAHDLLGGTVAADPDEIAHPDERTVERWTRCTGVTVPVGAAR
ncbi:pyridoxal-5'-phosphate-dependent protein subunit beta [Streptomyces pluripotens]|uniref:Pyridoxal-5'-phosphate-dependent protein subunit beta n=1 Tax=Streptomyces pluripotens TaxID=1355015 RepID=A0A221P6M3_9ACTN|nr:MULTISPECIES: PLP-dependent cysteine synthase family protein [Streptomyces]ARP73524.1 pyridoxal-5'-phosphate-dependent protein subunit beta [Streptomyces pluripotens]ASN27774.1 pyridoxal-5'-phosphate-dependent protein subunit beta [Streptomyces pluripotens]MCH0557302.1 PLP-dependent cysteine synthase family protein [Streptomyces sp. MUM 16J]